MGTNPVWGEGGGGGEGGRQEECHLGTCGTYKRYPSSPLPFSCKEVYSHLSRAYIISLYVELLLNPAIHLILQVTYILPPIPSPFPPLSPHLKIWFKYCLYVILKTYFVALSSEFSISIFSTSLPIPSDALIREDKFIRLVGNIVDSNLMG